MNQWRKFRKKFALKSFLSINFIFLVITAEAADKKDLCPAPAAKVTNRYEENQNFSAVGSLTRPPLPTHAPPTRKPYDAASSVRFDFSSPVQTPLPQITVSDRKLQRAQEERSGKDEDCQGSSPSSVEAGTSFSDLSQTHYKPAPVSLPPKLLTPGETFSPIRHLALIGTILDWWGPHAERVPPGFLICNGQIVAFKDSPLFGQRVPNLIHVFTRGTSDPREVETVGDSHQFVTNVITSPSGGHTHSFSQSQNITGFIQSIEEKRCIGAPNNRSQKDKSKWFHLGFHGASSTSQQRQHQHDLPDTASCADHVHNVIVSAAISPPFVSVLKIIRVVPPKTKEEIIPVGTILDWWRPNMSDQQSLVLPRGFVLCDGNIIEDRESYFNGERAPNLHHMFIKGVGMPDKVGIRGGSEQQVLKAEVSAAGLHVHAFQNRNMTGFISSKNADKQTLHNEQGKTISKFEGSSQGDTHSGQHQHDLPLSDAQGVHIHEVASVALDILPPYINFLKMMRIK
ncbi:hypothetical protein [Candidatus Finniella inopinata]|uniref:Phage tail collar domain-containing protein n=1 Tax=Candidatus Finniella inopinata TaxID=1696036 RepID=A0A4V2DZL4_9PROT|nr:hypothetical protein [Candidatus Finniella inopinata]RZI45467.1 hypothetical protein EQU50_06900 [Candidatus Finniella inopinata]